MTWVRRGSTVLGTVLGLLLLGGSYAWAQPSDTSTVTCGTAETPCVTSLDEQQYLGLSLMVGTLLLVALTSFLLRHGRALRV